MSVEANHPDSHVLAIMAKAMHDDECKCGSWPCGLPRLRYDPTPQARIALNALLAAGYDWVRLSGQVTP